jgi:UDP-N-acetylmuramate: L-alanyl-gamma-D-glutamyl-meso-diaminopimelate ligase
MIAVGGTGMAPLACLLQGRGHRVRGSDGPLYPPMSTLLDAAGIRPLVGFDPAHLQPVPDLVVVGNAVPRSNPEALEAERLRRDGALEILSMPEALWRFFLAARHRVVVAGTHGKTTTTSMASWVWTDCGAEPSYLIGGLPKDLPGSFHDGAGSDFLIEGDEYNAAYFDQGPKFLHYRPDTLILTSAEYDHADLYPTHEALLEAYRALVESVPEDGLLVACGDDPEIRRLVRRSRVRCRTILYGLGSGSGPDDLVTPAGPVETGPEGSRFRVPDPFEANGGPEAPTREIRLAVPGRHNAANALAVWIAARHRGLDGEAVAAAFGRFHGVARRLDELGTVHGVTVIDDFAHHPTAVAESLAALRRRFPDRRLTALFEPRSLTAGRSFLRDAYGRAFRRADRVLFAPVFHAGRLEPGERIDFAELAVALSADGVEAAACDSIGELRERALAGALAGDVLVTMSSGSFDGLPRRLVEDLRSRS